MRRLLSITLLLAVVLPFFAPAFAWASDGDSHLPACCRRNGAHHCNGRMTAAATPDGHHHLGAPANCCPLFPHAIAAPHTAPFTAPANVRLATFDGRPRPDARPIPSHRQTLRDRSRSQRGPPHA